MFVYNLKIFTIHIISELWFWLHLLSLKFLWIACGWTCVKVLCFFILRLELELEDERTEAWVYSVRKDDPQSGLISDSITLNNDEPWAYNASRKRNWVHPSSHLIILWYKDYLLELIYILRHHLIFSHHFCQNSFITYHWIMRGVEVGVVSCNNTGCIVL